MNLSDALIAPSAKSMIMFPNLLRLLGSSHQPTFKTVFKRSCYNYNDSHQHFIVARATMPNGGNDHPPLTVERDQAVQCSDLE